jgi:hypothetical protein
MYAVRNTNFFDGRKKEDVVYVIPAYIREMNEHLETSSEF